MKKFLFIFTVCLSACANQDSQKSMQESDWARPAQQGGNSAAYFIHQNNSEIADTLLSVESSAAAMTQIHESYTTDDGLMGMREMEEIIAKPGEKLHFEQGGLHVMLMDLNKDLKAGDTLQIAIHWTASGEKLYKIPVKELNSKMVDNH